MSRPRPQKINPASLKHPEKYAGDKDNIITRSSWERRLIKWLDENNSVLFWASEELVVPYISPLDSKTHRYFVDFVAKLKLKDGTEKIFGIEVKPMKEMKPPRKSNNQTRMLTETTTYIVNQAKWESARKFCTAKGWEFLVLNEYDLGIK